MALRLTLRGTIQGVGLRPWIWHEAHALGLTGRVSNVRNAVTIEAHGPPEALDALCALAAEPPLRGAHVDDLEVEPLDAPAPGCFEIAPSPDPSEERRVDVALAPDLALCDACRRELGDRASRRYRYAFTACAHCGPRYTMARALPYDRARTAMADFPLCAECAAEYARPDDRRFHAEATACPKCGPGLLELSSQGEPLSRDEQALARAVEMLRSGGIVAVQGIGGFHLACDAGDETAVMQLRARKRRLRKPLAVMLPSLAEVEKHAVVSADERALLLDPARPIVLLRWRSDSGLAPSIAPGSRVLGVLLAYTPLHDLLLENFGGPLVMTSANRSEEPIVYRRDDCVSQLADLADRVVAHEREIVVPCDDSVAVAAGSGPILLRRSRGHVPRPIVLAAPLRHTVLALGGQWNNTICLAHGDRAWLSAHVGDVESPDSVKRLEETARRWIDWLGVSPDLIAHDLHPGYETTHMARAWGGARAVGVQHHHAHMTSVLAEHRHEDPALALTWDGTGAGPGGDAWGGELLLGDRNAFERLATLRPISLAGGERAIREPWRLALALLDDAFDGAAPLEALALFQRIPRARLEKVRALLSARGLCPSAHGVGRYFDAVGALLLARPAIDYSGELAQALGSWCSDRPAEPYPFAIDTTRTPWSVDLRATLRALVGDLRRAAPPDVIADRFHASLIAAGDAAVRKALPLLRDRLPATGRARRPAVALGGGCFQNPVLMDGLDRALRGDLQVLRPHRVPPGDGGLALGQALVANATALASLRSSEEV
jgi:hydrogenase maturation protein HypF